MIWLLIAAAVVLMATLLYVAWDARKQRRLGGEWLEEHRANLMLLKKWHG